MSNDKSKPKPKPNAMRRGRQVVRFAAGPPKTPSLVQAPGHADALTWSASLADPFNAPYNVGIPIGGAGFPTFKGTAMFRAAISTTPLVAAYAANNVSWASGNHVVELTVALSATGNLTFSWKPDPAGASTVLKTYQYDHPRIVAAAIRVQRMGRADEAGIEYYQYRNCYDGPEAYPSFTTEDKLQMNYVPKSNWDLEYKLNVTNHPTNFSSSFALGLRTNTACSFSVDFIAIVETNDDTPPASVWNTADYHVVVPSITQPAPTLLPAKLNDLGTIAMKGTFVPPHDSQYDPSARSSPRFLTTISNAAKAAESWLTGATKTGEAIKGAWKAAEKFAPLVGGLLL